MHRRQFLQLSLAASAYSLNWRLWAAPSAGSTRFILVFLRGGLDALSVLVPYTEPFYYEARPTIALAKPHTDDPSSVLALNSDWGLHPALRESIYPLYQAGQVAFVPFSGVGFESRSHFQAQDWLEYGQGAAVDLGLNSGFLNRLLNSLETRGSGISFTAQLPPALQGRYPVANSPIILKDKQVLNAGYEQLLQAMYKGHTLETLAKEGLGLRHQISAELQQEMQTAGREAIAPRGFALEARRIATLLRDQPNYNVGFIDVGGWDTHIDQGAAHGQLSNHLEQLGTGLAALAEGLGKEWQRTVVCVVSEFGRTFQENGSRGSDHGYGSTLWFLGGAIKGGAIKGRQTRLASPAHLHENRDTPMLNENRDVLGGVFKQLYGLNDAALQAIFPKATPQNLGLL